MELERSVDVDSMVYLAVTVAAMVYALYQLFGDDLFAFISVLLLVGCGFGAGWCWALWRQSTSRVSACMRRCTGFFWRSHCLASAGSAACGRSRRLWRYLDGKQSRRRMRA